MTCRSFNQASRNIWAIQASIDTYRAVLKAYERDQPRLRKIADSASPAISDNVDTTKNGVVTPDKEKVQ
jgi:hypothetical protein